MAGRDILATRLRDGAGCRKASGLSGLWISIFDGYAMSVDGDEWVTMQDEGFMGLVGPIEYRPFGADGIGHFRFKATEKHRNRAGIVHGGMLMTMADRALGYTARHKDPDRKQATIHFDMHFVRPARAGDTLQMDCQVVRETGSLAFVNGNIHANGKTIARAQGIWKIIGKPRPTKP